MGKQFQHSTYPQQAGNTAGAGPHDAVGMHAAAKPEQNLLSSAQGMICRGPNPGDEQQGR